MYLRIFLAIAFLQLIASFVDGFVASGESAYISTRLAGDISATDTNIYANTSSGFPDYGMIKIDDEYIRYGDIVDNTVVNGNIVFTDCQRAQWGTDQTKHYSGDTIYSESAGRLNDATDFENIDVQTNFGVWSFVTNNPIKAITNYLTWNFEFLQGTNIFFIILRSVLSIISICIGGYFGYLLWQVVFGGVSGIGRLFGR